MDMLEQYIKMIGDSLYKDFPDEGSAQGNVIKAAKYSLSAGGKRVRPVLTLAFCVMCGGKAEDALDAACAVEYMHTYSLIHDDLPCMDNDDMRRGKPSCHKAFGETTALLAGDMLAILPFERISRSKTLGPLAAVKCIRALSVLCGAEGMIGGQQIDTENAGKDLPEDLLLSMYSMKTAALIKAACLCGVYSAQCVSPADEARYAAAAGRYAENLGIAFQIIDDILDVTGNTEELGKSVGNDAECDKHTYVRVNGIHSADEAAGEYTRRALDALGCFRGNDLVKQITIKLLGRKK